MSFYEIYCCIPSFQGCGYFCKLSGGISPQTVRYFIGKTNKQAATPYSSRRRLLPLSSLCIREVGRRGAGQYQFGVTTVLVCEPSEVGGHGEVAETRRRCRRSGGEGGNLREKQTHHANGYDADVSVGLSPISVLDGVSVKLPRLTFNLDRDAQQVLVEAPRQ